MKIEDLDVLERLARLPDDVALNTAEAAVFLRTSVTTLERYRRSGEGPAYSQAGGAGAKGTNQRCLYIKADLKAWVSSNRVSSSLEAAVRRGQMFLTGMEITEPIAFWRNPKGQLAGLVEDASVELFFARLGLWNIEWISPEGAASDNWESSLAQRAFVSECAKHQSEAVVAQSARKQNGSEISEDRLRRAERFAVALEAGDLTPEQVQLLLIQHMPFGKYQGRCIADLPRSYIEWFASKGFCEGEIGDLMALMHKVYSRQSAS